MFTSKQYAPMCLLLIPRDLFTPMMDLEDLCYQHDHYWNPRDLHPIFYNNSNNPQTDIQTQLNEIGGEYKERGKSRRCRRESKAKKKYFLRTSLGPILNLW